MIQTIQLTEEEVQLLIIAELEKNSDSFPVLHV